MNRALFIPKNSETLIKILFNLIRSKEFAYAEDIYTKFIHRHCINDPMKVYNNALELLRLTLCSPDFKSFKNSDFDKLFFLDHLLFDDYSSLLKINGCYINVFGDAYVSLANKYILEKGGKFVYASVDVAATVKNNSWQERELLALSETDFYKKNYVSWMKSCPPHIKAMHEELPEFSTEYIHNIFSVISGNFIKQARMVCSDQSSEYVNVQDNKRVTTDTPEKYSNKCFVLGASDVFSYGCEDKRTFCSVLQRKLLDQDGKVYKVENHGVRGLPRHVCLNNLFQLNINPGDVVVIFGFPKLDPKSAACIGLDTVHCSFQRPHNHGEIFSDIYHPCWKGHQIIADTLYAHIFNNQNKTCNSVKNAYHPNMLKNLETGIILLKYMMQKKSTEKCDSGELKEYIDHILQYRLEKNGTYGSIAVNCNPITLGHLSLMEYAAKQVDHLFIFVIEEDMSFFTYETRFKLVKEGTLHLPNVTVLRGGRYICTELTVPDYFSKDEKPNVIIDLSMEAWFFGEYIAKALNINKIFLGKEPLCPITHQYNTQMADMLPGYGIEVNIIDRTEKDGMPISASQVRQKMKVNDFEGIKRIVPECTYKYLLEKHS